MLLHTGSVPCYADMHNHFKIASPRDQRRVSLTA
jgi:hypothetical protein